MTLYSDKTLIADELADKFVIKGSDNSNAIARLHESVATSVDNFRFQEEDIVFAFNSLKGKSNNVVIEIPIQFTNNTLPVLKAPLCMLFNHLSIGIFPENLKHAIICLLYT